jgi:single-strand DNA-binding protein
MNDTQITLTGWIGGDVTLREVAGGRAVVSFRLACTPTRYRDGEWVKGTTSWHTVKAWNRLARHVAASLHNGDPVVVHGRLVADVWERDGKPQTSFEVVASSVGHDLTHGTATFSRPEPAVAQPAAQPAAESVVETAVEPVVEPVVEPAPEPRAA